MLLFFRMCISSYLESVTFPLRGKWHPENNSSKDREETGSQDRVQAQVRSLATTAGLGEASLQLPGLHIKVITSQHPNVKAPSTALFGFKMKNK